jgi:NarL family two-component system response regulator LiaR
MTNESKTIRILIADDHSITRSGIKTVLSICDDLTLVGEAANGAEALDMCDKARPDVILMDVNMPVMDGVEATVKIKEKCPNIKIIALTSYVDKKLVTDMLKAGAISYVIKNISPDELVKAIRDAYLGKTTFSSEASKAVVEELTNPSSERFNLTGKEQKVLKLLSKGYSNENIAKELFISSHTVKFHISNILNKLGVASRTEAVFVATKNDLIN